MQHAACSMRYGACNISWWAAYVKFSVPLNAICSTCVKATTRGRRQQPGAEADHVCKPTLVILLRKGANAHNEAQVRVPFGAAVRVNVQPETVW
jgi:hypothetical protein